MVASLKELSNPQLCQVFNAITGQKVKRFTSITDGVHRIAKVLNATGTRMSDALEMAGIEFEEPHEELPAVCVPVEALPDPNECAVPSTPETEKYRDKYGFVHVKREAKAPKRNGHRAGGKLEIVLELLRRPDGATVKDIMQATGWQAHTTRAYLSKGGAAGRAVTIASERVEGERDGPKVTVYWVAE